jgi:predicted transcriptional regulator
MVLSEITKILDAQVYCGEDSMDLELRSACGSDMMSEVLAYAKDQSVLLTGLLNPQAVRTAEMMDMQCIVFVRGKIPTDAILELARERGICVLATKATMFTACGLLYERGLRGGDGGC